jgi:hypothetical protein
MGKGPALPVNSFVLADISIANLILALRLLEDPAKVQSGRMIKNHE